MRKVRLFVCYERDDDEHWFAADAGRPWLGSKGFVPWLQENLQAIVEKIWWDDQGILTSEEWEKRIHYEIDQADVAILLIGQGFLNSRFIMEQELPHIRRRVEEGYMEVFPIVSNRCRWEDCQELNFVQKRQMRPVQKMPLIEAIDNRPQWLQVRNQLFQALKDVSTHVLQRRQIHARVDFSRSVPNARPQEKALRVTAVLEAGSLKYTACVAGKEELGVRSYPMHPFSSPDLDELVKQVEDCLRSVDAGGKAPEGRLATLIDAAQKLHGMLIPHDLAQFIAEYPWSCVTLELDGALTFIPWELLHDGTEFLCQKHAMGRVLLGSQTIFHKGLHAFKLPIRMLIVANPRGDLPATRVEGRSIQEEFGEVFNSSGDVEVKLLGQETTCDELEAELDGYDLFHFAGHSDYIPNVPSESGLLLADGKFTVERFLSLAKGKRLPSLIFTNSCQSGLAGDWSVGRQLQGLASIFQHSGVSHYVGGTTDLLDRYSSALAQEFYRQLIDRRAVGEALRLARLKCIDEWGANVLSWSSYVLYGDPSFRYFAPRVSTSRADIRSTDAQPGRQRKFMAWAAGALLLLLGLGAAGWHVTHGVQEKRAFAQGFSLVHAGRMNLADQFFNSLDPKNPLHDLGMTSIYLQRGQVAKAEETFGQLTQKGPGSTYSQVVGAHLALGKGRFDDSESMFRKALESRGLEPWQRAECHFGLGRVLLHRNDPGRAVEEFNQAIHLDPQFVQAYTSKGMALERMGNASAAMDCYQLALNINAEDPVNANLYRRSRDQLAFFHSSEKRARVDALVKDLMQVQTQGPQSGARQDPWKSKPLSFFVANLEVKGQPASRDGEDDLIVEQLAQGTAEGTRLQLVERALLDRLLEELKLSSFQLADPETAVRVGKILTARIIIAGSLHRHDGQVRINLRAIDTETTKVPATASTLCWTTELGTALESLTKEFQKKILSFYPLRGRITGVAEGEATIDLGRDAGIAPGTKLRVVEKEAKGLNMEVTSVDDSTCTAAVPDSSTQTLQAGWRVEGT